MVQKAIQVRDLTLTDITECQAVLYSVPHWFGYEASNRAYIESLSALPGAVAVMHDEVVGFIAVAEHTPRSYEIHVMAVRENLHRQGIGRALIAWAESWCIERKAHWLHVKTRGPSTPDPGYERTRKFYIAQGFEPLFESLTMWNPQNAALILVKRLGGEG